jgi:cytoplasmic iron level regulating protein YaaA (DUF328/UPF0246 family)
VELILLACSNRKTKGGTQEYHQPVIKDYLTNKTYHKLLSLRKEIAQMKSIPPGCDLGDKLLSKEIYYKPAYTRYSGIVFSRSNFAELYQKADNKKVIIISALYGLLDAEDMIRDYEVKINETLPIRSRLYTWWKSHGLPGILEEYIINLKPKRIHDFLSNEYRLALSHWPSNAVKSQNIEYFSYNYPGQGQGASWRRGDDLKHILIQ